MSFSYFEFLTMKARTEKGGKPKTVTIINDIPDGKRLRQAAGPKMNKLETQFSRVLPVLHPGVNFRAQAWRVELATGIWFRVDFVGPVDGGWVAYEVKGPKAFRGGFENLKLAARLWPEIKWVLVWNDKKTGEWQKQEILP